MAYPDNLTCKITDDGKRVFATLGDLSDGEPATETTPAVIGERQLFESFLDDVHSVSPIDQSTGKGPFPSFQLIQLEEFAASDVLTKFPDAQSYDFDLTVQGNRHTFSILGSAMVTYQDLLDQVNSNAPGLTATYTSMTPNTNHRAVITSNTAHSGGGDDGNGGQVASIASRIKIDKFLSENLNNNEVITTTAGNKASDTAALKFYDASHVLTGFDHNTTYTTKIDVGTTPNTISGTGADFPTYFEIIKRINDDEIGVVAKYHTDFPRANQISIVGGVDTDTIDQSQFDNEPNPEAAYQAEIDAQILANFNNTIVISNFSMFTSTPIVHSLKVPVHGGRDLTDVIKYSYREDKLVWREIVPFEWTNYYWGVAPGT